MNASPALHVLHVEDSPTDALLTREELSHRPQYRLTQVDRLGTALGLLATGSFAVVLLDLGLPDSHGLDTLTSIRRAYPHTAVVVMTANEDEDLAVLALQEGAQDYIVKSQGRESLLVRTIRYAIERQALKESLRKSEERFRAFMDHSPATAFIKDEAGRYVYVNRTYRRQFAPEHDSIEGKTDFDLWPRETAALFRASDELCLDQNAMVQREETARTREGHEATWLVLKFPLTDDGHRRIGGMAWDVTDRKRAEADRKRAADLLHAVADGTADALFVKDRAGKYLLFNAAAGRFVGKPAADVLGKDDTELFDAAGARRVMDRDRRVMATGAVETQEETLTAAGVTRTYLATKGPYRDARGEIAGVIGISHDMTDRKRAEAERDRALRQLRVQIDRMPLGYVLFDADSHVVEWNAAAERIFGYSKAEVLGMGPLFEKILSADIWPEAEKILQRIRAGETAVASVTWNRARDGREILCEWTNSALLDAGRQYLGMISLVQDITERRAAELQLRLQDRAMRAVTQGILITDPARSDNPIVYVSPGFEQITGYAAAEAVGRNCRFLQGKKTDPDAVARIREAVRAGESCRVEILNYRKDGAPFWNELSLSPVRDEDNRLTHFVGVQSDVTARRTLEEQFRQSQKMEAVGQLAGGVAHDFNNLLTIINGYSELLLEQFGKGDPARDLVAEIHKAGERSAGLTRQLLAFSRQQVLSPRVLDLNVIVADTGAMLRRVIGEDVQLTVVAAPNLWPVKADPGQVEQVLMNLCVNARDAMPQGGRITVETQNVYLDESYTQAHADTEPGPHVLLAVTDTGQGMSDDVKARVFEPFFTTKGPGKGTGLGLATVFGIVKQSGGHLGVYSEVGHGTTFKVYLPRVEVGGQAAKNPSQYLAPPNGHETILLVEDDSSVRALIRHVLTKAGYRVFEAASGDDALDALAGHPGPVHLLITDVVMPGIGGRSVAERITARHPGTRVLFISGYTDDAIVRHGVLHEKVNFLQKPFTPVSLAFKVREALDGPPGRGGAGK